MRVRTTEHGPLFQFEHLADQPLVRHAVAARPCNYAPHRGPGCEEAIIARQNVCQSLGLAYEKLTSPSQVHGPQVLPVQVADVGRGREGRSTSIPFVDGLICDLPGVPLVLMSGDCPLIAVFDPDRPAVGAVHASWHGTMSHASDNLVRQMSRCYGSRPERMLAAIAPSGGPCCYEVGQEVLRIAEGRLSRVEECFAIRDGRLYLDLWAANRRQLLDAGLQAEHIEIAGLCSICDQRFWSHRREGAQTGRFALFIGLGNGTGG